LETSVSTFRECGLPLWEHVAGLESRARATELYRAKATKKQLVTRPSFEVEYPV
jgi:hypothetical protein